MLRNPEIQAIPLEGKTFYRTPIVEVRQPLVFALHGSGFEERYTAPPPPSPPSPPLKNAFYKK